MDEIRYHGSVQDFRRTLRALVDGLAGRSNEYPDHVRRIKIAVGLAALECIQEAFIVKADGGMGDDGVVWPALKKATIAARAVGPSDKANLKAMGIKKGPKGFSARAQGAGELD